MQYIVLIHKNTDSPPITEEWNRFFDAAQATGMFRGGSAIGARQTIGDKPTTDTTENVAGYMRFDSDDLDRLRALLQEHPVIRQGGTIELCELLET